MSKGIKLGELKEHYNDELAEMKEENEERLSALDFGSIEVGPRMSEMSAVETMNVLSAENERATVYVEFAEDRGGGNETFTVTADSISGRLPNGVEVEREKFEKAILDALEG